MSDTCSFMEVIPTSTGGVEVISLVIYRHLTSEPIASANIGEIVDIAHTVKNNNSVATPFQCGVYINGNMWYQWGHTGLPAGASATDKQFYTISGPGDLTVCADIIS